MNEQDTAIMTGTLAAYVEYMSAFKALSEDSHNSEIKAQLAKRIAECAYDISSPGWDPTGAWQAIGDQWYTEAVTRGSIVLPEVVYER